MVDVDEENSRADRLDSLFSKFDYILYALSLPVWIQRGGSVRRRFSMERICDIMVGIFVLNIKHF